MLRLYALCVVADTTKVRIFKQITTQIPLTARVTTLLLIPQRYEFSSKSQPIQCSVNVTLCCCWYHKGTNFQANHNAWNTTSCSFRVVADTTKVRIFKQITTAHADIFLRISLLLIPQRYEFSSKSQPTPNLGIKPIGCCWYHKGTNFQANHNKKEVLDALGMLLLIPQRYEFSSKSQHNFNFYGGLPGCCWYHKGTNFQANHNYFEASLTPSVVVADTTKVRIFKQITTEWTINIIPCRLLLIPQRYEFSSKSQLEAEV